MGKVEGVDDATRELLAKAAAGGVTNAEVVAKGVVRVIATDPLPGENSAQ